MQDPRGRAMEERRSEGLRADARASCVVLGCPFITSVICVSPSFGVHALSFTLYSLATVIPFRCNTHTSSGILFYFI